MKKKIRLSSGFGVKRVGFIASVLMLVVYVALSLSPVSHAQFECLEKCQEALANCLAASHGDPGVGIVCEDNYDACWPPCIGF